MCQKRDELRIHILPRNKMATNTKCKLSLKYLGGIIFHGLEYVIRHEIDFCFIF